MCTTHLGLRTGVTRLSRARETERKCARERIGVFLSFTILWKKTTWRPTRAHALASRRCFIVSRGRVQSCVDSRRIFCLELHVTSLGDLFPSNIVRSAYPGSPQLFGILSARVKKMSFVKILTLDRHTILVIAAHSKNINDLDM